MVDPLRRQGSGRPNDRRTPIVADEMVLLEAEMVEHCGEVDREERDRIRLDLRGLVAGAVAALVVGDHLEAGVEERWNLLRPQALCVGETVHENDRTAFALHLHVEGNTV